MDPSTQPSPPVRAGSLAELRHNGRLLVKKSGRQIAIFLVPGDTEQIYACNNRCPHEGYPLIEGSLNNGCELTCNWHNWKFDLDTGKTLIGGDQLRHYPVSIKGGDIYLDLSCPPAAEQIKNILGNLIQAMPEHEYDRIAREIARLVKVGGDPLDALRATIIESHDRFEYGSGHAYAASADWLHIYQDMCAPSVAASQYNDEVKLVPLLESVGHIAWDTYRQSRRFEFTQRQRAWDAKTFAAAIEAQDEGVAIACLTGALQQGCQTAALKRAFIEASLAHYQGFGHALIYTYKAQQLIEILGPSIAPPVLKALTRYLCNAAREDLVPEFRPYAQTLKHWDGKGTALPDPKILAGLSIGKALKAVSSAGANPQALFSVLYQSACLQMLHFDYALDERCQNPVAKNANWLDFTHTMTFANALHWATEHWAHAWPAGLLQMACFIGRNSNFLSPDEHIINTTFDDLDVWVEQALHAHLDHSYAEYIVSCHYLKLLVSVREELHRTPNAPWRGTLGAALQRMLSLPIKRKHLLRVAHQASVFVNKED